MTTELAKPAGRPSFDYTNLSGRPPAALLTRLAPIVRGVRETLGQVAPWAAWWRANNVRALSSGRPLWVVLGDSLSQGIGASSPEHGWVGRVAADPPPRLRDAAVLNLSFNGARALDVLETQLPAHDVLRHHHEIACVTLLIGNNDLMNPRWCRRLPTTMSRLLDVVPDGTVVARQSGMQRTAAEFNAVLHRAAARRDLHVADFRVPHLRDFVGRLGRDFFHPSDRGYAQMADAVRAAL